MHTRTGISLAALVMTLAAAPAASLDFGAGAFTISAGGGVGNETNLELQALRALMANSKSLNPKGGIDSNGVIAVRNDATGSVDIFEG